MAALQRQATERSAVSPHYPEKNVARTCPAAANTKDLRGGGTPGSATGKRPMAQPEPERINININLMMPRQSYCTMNDVEAGVLAAMRGRANTRAAQEWLKDKDAASLRILAEALSLSVSTEYRQLQKTNANGKVRKIDAPSTGTLVRQHLWMELVMPYYMDVEPGVARNCLPGRGVTAEQREGSILKEAKRLFYDRRELQYLVCADQRQCYQRLTVKAYRRGMKALRDSVLGGLPAGERQQSMAYWRWLTDLGEQVSFVDGRLPIGTPTSPLVHHIAMLPFDLWLKEQFPWVVRYADNAWVATATVEEARQALWRIRQYWWYVYGLRAKRHTASVVPIGETGADLCGYVVKRLPCKTSASHDKGVTAIRPATLRRAVRCRDDRSWASYFGLLRHADCYGIMKDIEQRMKLTELTQRVRIDREMDARHIDMKDLEGQVHNLYKYEIRRGKEGDNWMKALIGIPETDRETGQPTGRIRAYEYHGNYQGIIRWLRELEKAGISFLPIEEGRIVNECGYIYEGSTNQIEFIEEEQT